ncbi:PGAP1 family protein [Bacillus sp. OxB-1]|uniref:alpha/beta hydrolase family protein n=1 Tax=Bacillus sp. (strain OxB-1) TaxID=98228 RepID=UPI0005821745|nr:alpha/beta fold hydrolase [Bacillus sp. OxB-1]BAQ08760.1 PGAP1 family protein [Bacillus sp. OxB-1]
MSQPFTILASADTNLSGALHLPTMKQQIAIPLIVLLHGFVGNKVGEHRLFVKAARHFTDRGYAVVRFDFSGCGESDGDYAQVTMTKQLQEVQAVLDHLSSIKEIDARNVILIGHSLGGAIAALTAAQDCRIKKLVLWSPVGTPYEDITGILGIEKVNVAIEKGKVDYEGFYVGRPFLDDLKKHHPIEAARLYKGPALVIHADADEDVPKKHAARYLAALHSRPLNQFAETHYIEDADHTFSSYAFEEKLFETTVDWLDNIEFLGRVAL